jgi:hypothetical protein
MRSSLAIVSKSQERPESPTDKARRHVAEAEARCVRQREILRGLDTTRHPDAVENASRGCLCLEAGIGT